MAIEWKNTPNYIYLDRGNWSDHTARVPTRESCLRRLHVRIKVNTVVGDGTPAAPQSAEGALKPVEILVLNNTFPPGHVEKSRQVLL